MKPLAVYALFMGTAMTAFFSSLHEGRPSYYAQLEPIELGSPVKLSGVVELPTELPAFEEAPSRKSYNIFFENKTSSPMKVAIRYKSIDGGWQTDGLTTLPPGERKLMGQSDEKVYYYHVADKSRSKKKSATDGYKFPIKTKSRKKVAFQKKEIWECYNKEVCNALAVFR
ncbi:DUF1036 domain-containing protein [Roseivirga misakiensis]|uniref:Uncharacterized protein n=1 Tax=Roseivirga misakiensis TaxID=1563681 RepID=A0A1E5SKG1_9BACT|nr:DUF1036 domain-containing protein [Roseivirga misakiensis]OEJ99610.1 hypothetical protein BFP71_08540 [Roseivirga misakiensis]